MPSAAPSTTRRCPTFPAFRLHARRNINLAIIGYAESLCEHVDAFGLAARAKEAVARRVHEMSFGTARRLRGLHAAGAEGAGRGRRITSRSPPGSEPSSSGCAPPASTATPPTPCPPPTRWPPPASTARRLDAAGTSSPKTTGTFTRCCCASRPLHARGASMRVGAPRLRRPQLVDAATAPRNPRRSATSRRG